MQARSVQARICASGSRRPARIGFRPRCCCVRSASAATPAASASSRRSSRRYKATRARARRAFRDAAGRADAGGLHDDPPRSRAAARRSSRRWATAVPPTCVSRARGQRDAVSRACAKRSTYFGGVTAASAVRQRQDGRHRARRLRRGAASLARGDLLDLAEEYGFAPRLCRPYRARTKGKVERFNGYLKGSFMVPLAATLQSAGLQLDATTANAHVGRWLDRGRQRARARHHRRAAGSAPGDRARRTLPLPSVPRRWHRPRPLRGGRCRTRACSIRCRCTSAAGGAA